MNGIGYRRPNEPRPRVTVQNIVVELSDGTKNVYPVDRPIVLRYGKDAGQIRIDLIDQRAHVEQR